MAKNSIGLKARYQPKEHNLKFVTLNKSAEDMISKNSKECTTEKDLKDIQEPIYGVLYR